MLRMMRSHKISAVKESLVTILSSDCEKFLTTLRAIFISNGRSRRDCCSRSTCLHCISLTRAVRRAERNFAFHPGARIETERRHLERARNGNDN